MEKTDDETGISSRVIKRWGGQDRCRHGRGKLCGSGSDPKCIWQSTGPVTGGKKTGNTRDTKDLPYKDEGGEKSEILL